MSKIDLETLAKSWSEKGIFEDKAKDYEIDVEKLGNAWVDYQKVFWSMVSKYGEEIVDFMDDQAWHLTRDEVDDISNKAYERLGFEIIGTSDR